jgi:hypothetical protein
MLVCGLEAMVVTRDAAGLDTDEAIDTMVWAAQALIHSARTNR